MGKITFEKVVYELKSKKNRKAPENDQTAYDSLKTAPESLLRVLVEWYNIVSSGSIC